MDRSFIRPNAVAGMFYPEGSSELTSDIEQLFNQTNDTPVSGTVVGLIVPHAGYMYSGSTAAYAYRLLKKHSFDSVIIVAPSHAEYFDGISVYNGSGYETPLGNISIDAEMRNALLKNESMIEASERGHRNEHAVEVQLPFLQNVLPSFRFLPIVMGDQRKEYCFHLGKKLAHILAGKHSLLIASTDLSHYHTYQEAKNLDHVFIHDVEKFDCELLINHLDNETTEACGGGPAVAVMTAAKLLGANSIRILHHCNSGDITGDQKRVVGYVSAAIVRTN